MAALLTLDGSHGEGGGALVRTALAMAALTQQPLRIEGVRSGTRYPGLDAEDLTLLKVLREMCAAETPEAEIGSPTLSFLPTRTPRRPTTAQIATDRASSGRGASAPILLATLAPVLARTGVLCDVTATGETFGTNALGADGFARGTLAAYKALNLYAAATHLRAGWGRESDGRLGLEVEPGPFTGLQWADRGASQGLRATVSISNLPRTVAERAESHLRKLAQHAKLDLTTEIEEVPADTAGVAVTVVSRYVRGLGMNAVLGAKGMRVEGVAQSAFDGVFEWMAGDATLDPFLAEHVVLPLALAEGPSELRISKLTSRFLTSVWVIKRMAPVRITVRGTEGGPGAVAIAR